MRSASIAAELSIGSALMIYCFTRLKRKHSLTVTWTPETSNRKKLKATRIQHGPDSFISQVIEEVNIV